MADLEGEGWSSLESNIISRLKVLEEDPLKVEEFGQLIPLAHSYTQRNRRVIDDPSVPSSESEFHPHQLCGRCEVSQERRERRRRSESDGKEEGPGKVLGEEDAEEGARERKLRFRLQVCMLRTLSFKVKRSIAIWLNGLARQAYSCTDCYRGLIRAKQEIGPRFLHAYEEERIEQFLSFVDEWEEKIALKKLSDREIISEEIEGDGRVKREPQTETERQHDQGKGAEEGDEAKDEVFAALQLVGSLASRGKRKGLYDLVKQARTKLSIERLTEIPVGILAYAFDDDETVRNWACEQRAHSMVSREVCRTGTLEKLIREALAKERWQGLCFIAKWAPEAFSGALLPKLLSHKGKAEVLSCVEAILEQGAAVWLHEDPEYPLVILASLLDSMEALSDPNENSFRWMEAFLFSLLDPAISTEKFEDALKRMANFLLERMQGGHISLARRRRALKEGASLLLCWANGDERTRKPLSNVTELYASTIAQFALMGRIPNTNTNETTATEDRRGALDLIERTFELDKDSLVEGMLLLSNQTVRHKSMLKKAQIARKKQQAQTPPNPAYNDESAVFEESATDLELLPTVCSALWRECYNAFRPSEDAGLFLRPLASLAVFVEPQIQSYIIVKEHKSTAFPIYKEKLKSSILALSRRLKTMRGSLPTILLDISEECVASGGGSDQLSELCFRQADGLIAATLCPEPEVHRAAQNVIRTAFEEAETRGDCFRCLLQCSPRLALAGIQTYLDNFVTAATTLVEANDAAKWMVRSFSDVVEALCSPTDGLLQRGAPFSLVEAANTAEHVRQHIPAIWSLMCKSIAAIFAKTPSWARVLDQSELTAWFRDVLIFATDVVEQIDIFQDAAFPPEARTSESPSSALLQDLSLPLEEASSWLRMNDADIVEDTREYIVRALQHFRTGVPEGVKRRMLTFINDQIKIKDAEERRTLLSIDQLKDLRHLLDPSATAIELSDDDDDVTFVEQIPKGSKETKADQIPALPAPSKATADSQKKLKQQKLAFGSLKQEGTSEGKSFASTAANNSALASASKSREEALASKLAPFQPWTANKYASPTTFTSRAVSRPGFGQGPPAPAPAPAAPSRPGSKLAQLRQDYKASKVSAPMRTNYVRPTPPATTREIGDPRAPEAKRSFSSANLGAAAQAAGPSKPERVEDSSSDESSEDDDDEEKRRALGLAALTKSNSPVKMKFKPKVTQAPQRRTILLENTNGTAAAAAAAARERERETAERRKRLREAPDYGPLHLKILSWEYAATGDLPPRTVQPYRPAKPAYESAEDYMGVFGPMLLLECWAEFQSAKEDLERARATEAPYRITVLGRSAVNDFTVVNVVMNKVPATQSPRFTETDVVCLSDLSDPKAPASARAKILAKVDAFKPLGQGCRLTLRCCLIADQQRVNSRLNGDSKWEMTRLFSLTTLHREYEALQALRYYDMLPSILTGRAAYINEPSAEDVQRVEKRYAVNRPQAEAIVGTLTAGNGFSLVQGPPGTGKTKTISSLVAHFMATRPKPTSNPTPVNAGQRGPGPLVKKQARKKILLCAPSNAAIDELAKRVSDGIVLADGTTIRPSIVRVGRADAMNHSVKHFALETQVEEKLAKVSTGEASNEDVSAIHAEIQRLRKEVDEKQTQLTNVRAAGGAAVRLREIAAEIRQLVAKRVSQSNKLDEAKDKRQQVVRQMEANRRKVQQEILEEADVICSTLGGAGHALFGSLPFDFETVVIDEAAQAGELSTLIPLRYGCQRCILVGDPKQLPPVVLSRKSADLGYSNSLLLRMFTRPNNTIHLLSIQYRMHPIISSFPSSTFYDRKLLDGPNMARLTMKRWHNDEYLAPFQFFDITGGCETSGRGHSIINKVEAQAAAFLYQRLDREARRTASGSIIGKVGVVSMYKEQVSEVRKTFKKFFGDDIEEAVDFNTVDGFQGQEKDVIIISSVRTNDIGFLSDRRRINVAITRAKSNLFILGRASNLRKDAVWAQIVDMAERSKTLVKLGDPAKLRQPSNRPPMLAPPDEPKSSSISAVAKANVDPSPGAIRSPSKPPPNRGTPQSQRQAVPPPGSLLTPAQLKQEMRQASSSSAAHNRPPQPRPSRPIATSSVGIPILPPSNGDARQGPQLSRAAPPRPRPPPARPPRFDPLAGRSQPGPLQNGQPRPPSIGNGRPPKRPVTEADEQSDGPSQKALNSLFHTNKKPRIAAPGLRPSGQRPTPR